VAGAGTYNANSNTAVCRGNFAGCTCSPTANCCGPPQSCEAGGCGGTVDNTATQAATCKANYIGCSCIASAATPGDCGPIDSCSFAGCNGFVGPASFYGTCTGGAHPGCACVPDPMVLTVSIRTYLNNQAAASYSTMDRSSSASASMKILVLAPRPISRASRLGVELPCLSL